jgi:hypothetical protein
MEYIVKKCQMLISAHYCEKMIHKMDENWLTKDMLLVMYMC